MANQATIYQLWSMLRPRLTSTGLVIQCVPSFVFIVGIDWFLKNLSEQAFLKECYRHSSCSLDQRPTMAQPRKRACKSSFEALIRKCFLSSDSSALVNTRDLVYAEITILYWFLNKDSTWFQIYLRVCFLYNRSWKFNFLEINILFEFIL